MKTLVALVRESLGLVKGHQGSEQGTWQEGSQSLGPRPWFRLLTASQIGNEQHGIEDLCCRGFVYPQ